VEWLPDIVVLGAGESGVGAAILAQKKGFSVWVSDAGKIKQDYKNVLNHHGIKWEEQKHSEEIILKAKEIIKSPGIPEKATLIRRASENGIRVISEIEFAARYTSATKICITGSNGKTTTTSLIYHILKKAGLNVGVAGNIGKSFAWQVAEKDFDIYVLEISSFQLDGMFDFKAEIAILLNITPDHLDRYDYSFENYARSKFRILQNQTSRDYFIYWADDPVIEQMIQKNQINAQMLGFSSKQNPLMAANIIDNKISINIKTEEFEMDLKDMVLTGQHNAYNTMAAAITARILEIRKDVIKQSLTDFENIEHRLEHVSVVRGIEFINDSKATNINSAWYALESINKPIIWIVGGLDKGNDYAQISDLVRAKVKAIVCLGKDNSRILQAFPDYSDRIIETQSTDDAVKAAYFMGQPGDVVLLSPACASFDLFENFEERGRQFKQSVYNL
jgi:UDP-N-acetylmuramoylalanine--D-glutamate ligase